MTSLIPTPGSATQALIKRLMEFGLKQTEISEKTAIPQPRISRWAAGDVAAGADDALKLQALVNEYERKNRGRRAGDAISA